MKKKTKNNFLWKNRYYETNKKEHSLYLFNSLEIETAIKRIFKLYKLILNNFELKYSNSKLELFISYYATINSLKLLDKTIIKKSIYFNPLKTRKIETSNKKLYFKHRFSLVSLVKQYSIKQNHLNNFISKTNNFTELILESLSLFTKKKIKIVLILQNLNKGVTFRLKNIHSKILKENLVQFRKFSKFFFFKETINILLLTIYKSINLNLLTEFIAFQFSVIKKHNIFLIFLKQSIALIQNSNLSSIKGIKIIIKGRINGAPRARSKIIQTGNIPLQKIESTIVSSNSTSYTPNGTFSIKAWACLTN